MGLFLKNIFFDIIIGYKNFFHWNISKILVSLIHYILAFILILPLIIIFSIIVILSDYSLLEPSVLITSLFNPFYFFAGDGFLQFTLVGGVLLFLLTTMVLVFLFGLTYNRVLLARIHISYLSGGKLPFTIKKYLNIKLFLKSFRVTSLIFLYMLILLILGSIGFTILTIIFGGPGNINSGLEINQGINIFSIVSFVMVILLGLLLLYVLFRLIFAHILMLNNKKYTARQLILKSISLTKGWKILGKFSVLCLFLFIVSLPFNYVSQVIDFNSKNISHYIQLQGDKNTATLDMEEMKIYSKLNIKYGEMSSQELLGKSEFLYILQLIYFIFHFLFIYGMFELALVSFYKRELLKK